MKTCLLLFRLCLLCLVLSVAQQQAIGQLQLYWGASTPTAWTDPTWATELGGEYNNPWVDGSSAVFDLPGTSIVIGANTNFSSITANQNVIVVADGLLGTGGDIAQIMVADEKTFDFANQDISAAAGTGFVKNGNGTLTLNSPNSMYAGGFTLNAGTLVAKGKNAMGGGAGNSLTINGGTIAASGNMDFSGHFPNGITVGGNFTLGATTGLANSAANLTFSNSLSLGNNSTRTITIGGTGVYTLGGAVSGNSSHLNISASANGSLILAGTNTYTGTTTLNSGNLKLTGTLPSTNSVVVNGGTLEISSSQQLNSITVASGAKLSLQPGVILTISGGVSVNGTIECSANASVQGTGSFTLASGASIKTVNPTGISGSIQVTGTKTFDSNANYEFQGAGTGVFMTSPTPARVNNLSINRPSGEVSLQQNLTVSGNLSLMAGKLNLGGFDLDLKNEITGLPVFGMPSATYVIANGAGRMGRTAGANVVFPIGTSDLYMPCQVDGGSGTFMVSLSDPTAGLDPTKTLKKQWSIENSTHSNADISFQWPNNSSAQGANFPTSGDVKLYKYTTLWTIVGTATAPTAPPDEPKIVAFENVECCSKFSIGAEGAFPVELVEFRAALVERKTNLAWRTASEINNDYFAIEKSKDGRDFQEIGQLEGRGTTSEAAEYRFTDPTPTPGINYYRLRQVDTDGQFAFSKIVTVDFTGNARAVLFPTTTSNWLTLQPGQPISSSGELLILDSFGRQLRRETFEFDTQNLKLNVADLAPGTYFLCVNWNARPEMLRFSKI